MAGNLAAPPSYVVEREQVSGLVTDEMTRAFRSWLLALTTRIQATPNTLAAVPLTAQHAAIGTTSLQTATLSAGIYRLTYYTRITTAATVSSSLTVTLGWTDGTQALTAAGAALTGNTTSTSQTATVLVRADAASSLTYSTAYASVGGVAMTYSLDITVEAVA